LEKIKLDQLPTSLRNGKVILTKVSTGWSVLFDAQNTAVLSRIKSTAQIDFKKRHILFQSDRHLNQLINEVPAIAWDLLDSSEGELILLLGDGQKMYDPFKDTEGYLALRKTIDQTEQHLLRSSKTLLGIAPLRDQNLSEHKLMEGWIEVDYLLNLPPISTITLSIIKLESNGEVKILKP